METKPKTKLAGPWPTKGKNRQHNPEAMTLVRKKYAPYKVKTTGGRSVYADQIEAMLMEKPGEVCIQFSHMKPAKAFGHAVFRYLKHHELDKLRPSLRQEGQSVFVWVVEK